jgi:hypothetical protein
MLSRTLGRCGVNGRNADNTLIQRYLRWNPDTRVMIAVGV